MRRLLKILGVLIVLIIVALVGLVMFLPTGQIVQLVADQVKAQTGRDLQIAGDVSPSFYPVLGVEAEGITLSNAEWADGPNMVSATSAKIGVKLFPLISGSVQVEEVRLVDPKILLEVREDGTGNWEFETTSASADSGTQSSGDDGFVKELSFGETRIENGAVRFIDGPNGATYELTEINASIALTALDQPLVVDGDAVWNGEKADLDLTLGTIATLTAGAETEVDLSLASAPVTLTFKGALIPPSGAAQIEAGGAFSVTANDLAAAMTWALDEANPSLIGLTNLSLAGDVAVDATALAVDIKAGVSRAGQDASVALIASGGDSWATARAFTVDLAAGLGDAASVTFKGYIAAPDGAAPTVKGAYAVSSSSPGDVMIWALGAADPAVAGLADLALAGDVDLSDTGVSFSGAGGVVRDGERATVDLKAAGGPDWQSDMNFDVDAKLNVDGLARASYIGAINVPAGKAPELDGVYDIAVPSPSGAIAWATGAPADPGLADLSDVRAGGAITMTAAGLDASTKGSAGYQGQSATFDIAARSGAGWEASRAFTLNAKAGGAGLGDLNFNGDIAAPDGAAPSVNGAFSISAPNLRALASLAGASLPADNAKAFRSLSAAGSVSTPAPNKASVRLKSLQFDDITASGDLSVDYGGVLNVVANLNTGPLNLNPYLTTGAPTESGPGWSKEKLDLGALSSVNGDFALRAKSVTAQNFQLGVSDVRAKLNRGKLDLNIKELGVYGGGVQGDIVVDGAQNNALQANISASAIRLLPMLKSLADLDMIEGVGALNMNVAGGGQSMHAIMNSLNGSGGMTLNDGALVGYNLAAMVRNIKGAFGAGGGNAQKTDFSEISGTFDIRKGLLTNADFKFLGPLIRIFGQGDVNLGTQTMSFRLTPKAVSTLEGQGGAADVSGLSFPLLVSGPWSNLSIRPDLEGGIANLLKDPEGAIDAVKGAIESISSGNLDDAAGDVLKSVTGAAAGGAAVGGALKALENVTGGDSNPLSKALGKKDDDKAAKAKAKKVAKAKANADQLANLKEKIAKTKKNLDAAKEAGDRKRAKKIRDRLKKLRAKRDELIAGN